MDKLYILYMILNGIAFLLYGLDKYKAIKDQYRISEKKLLLVAFLGPFGGLFGMVLFRHKIRKIKFKLLIPLFIIIHILIYFFLII